MRLNTFIAKTGLCSRRKADILISLGKIKLNGSIVTLLGTKINPEKDVVEYKGSVLQLKKQNTYILINKPKACITTVKDGRGRKIVLDLLPNDLRRKRLFPVGRLDKDTTGVLILTDDGELANKLMHPRNEIEKTYMVILDRSFQKENREKLLKGIKDEGTLLKAKSVMLKTNRRIELILTEGKKREIKRMFKALGYCVTDIERTQYAFLTLKGLKQGNYRALTEKELKRLKTLTERCRKKMEHFGGCPQSVPFIFQ